MKRLLALLLLLLALLQYRLWFGDGGLLKEHAIEQSVAAQKAENADLQERNDALKAEVRDLKEGLAAIEERARTELGMVKQGETFFQVVEPQKKKQK